MAKVVIMDHPLIQHKIGIMRQKETSTKEFRALVSEVAMLIYYEASRNLPLADKEIERAGYAKKGSYASLFPQISINGSFQRTIQKQVMYMDFDMSSLGGFGGSQGGPGTGEGSGEGTGGEGSGTGEGTGGEGSGSGEGSGEGASLGDNGMEVGRSNTVSAGISASMPIINAQLWKSIQISGLGVELAVEKARSSRLEMVTQVKQAYYSTLLAKEAFKVYKDVYENALKNFEVTEKKYKVQKASEMEYLRAKTNLANAIPNVYNAESSIILALWQLKAVLGIDLNANIDTMGTLADFSEQMFRDIHENDNFDLEGNSTMRQLCIQAEQLAQTVKMQKYAYIPTLSLAFNYSFNVMNNTFDFSTWKWTPYSYIGVNLSIPIFTGGKRHFDVQQTKTQQTQLQYQMQDTELQLKIGIMNHLTTMETNMKTYNSSKEAVSLAQKSYDIVAKSYEIGRATLVELNDAQLALTQARLGESQAIYNFVVAKAQLEQMLGADFTNE